MYLEALLSFNTCFLWFLESWVRFGIFTLGVLIMRQQVGNICVIWVARAISFSDLIYHFMVYLKT